MTQGEDCPLDAIHRPDSPEAVLMVMSLKAETKTFSVRKRTGTSSHSAFSFFPSNCNWRLLGGNKPGRGAHKHVVKRKSVLVGMENSQECKIQVGFGSNLGAEV